MLRRDALAVAACASLLGACGYPDFAFEAPAEDSSVDDVASDGFVADARADSDAGVDAPHADVSDTLVAVDSGTESPGDVVGIDSGAETLPDVVAVDTFETSIDVVDAPPTCAPIDDMEDHDGYILVHCGRSGTWYTYNDGTGAQVPPEGSLCTPSVIVGGRASSTYAMDTSGGGFTSWGAGIGFNYIDGGPSYDASAWSGVQFWARTGSGTKTLHMEMADRDTDARGGICPTKPGGCGDHFEANVDLTTTWTLYLVAFTDLKQAGWGYIVPAFDPSAVYGVQWGIDAGSPFDIWIDDVAFFP